MEIWIPSENKPRCVLLATATSILKQRCYSSATSATAAALSSSLTIKCFNGSLLCQCAATECTSRSCFMYNLLFHCNLLLQRHGLSFALPLSTHTTHCPTISGPLILFPLFSKPQWLLWKCQRPHQRPLLLRCAVAQPSTAPHYWLTAPHWLRSIKAPPAAAPCRRLPGPVWAATQTQTDRG